MAPFTERRFLRLLVFLENADRRTTAASSKIRRDVTMRQPW